MKRLERLNSDPWAVFKAIRGAKKGNVPQRLDALAARVRQRFEEYQRHAESLEHLSAAQPAFDENERRVLNHCYTVSTKPLESLKRQIMECQSGNARSKCQYCGINSPDTFDHYIPREATPGFAEFAVYIDNLLPCCSLCNRWRGTNWLENQQRTCLHLYFDEIEENERFLFARIEFDDKGIPAARFQMDPERGTNRDFGQRYQRHFKKLHLCERFFIAAAAALERERLQIQQLHVNLGHDINTIENYLMELAVQNQRLLGANNWEVALSIAVAESRCFIEYCLQFPETRH